MKLRDIKNLPVFDQTRAEVIGRVERPVVGDDCRLAYFVVDAAEQGPGMILSEDCILQEESVIVNGPGCIKSYAHGEELSIYDKKIGDLVFDSQGKELGVVSDFILSPANKAVWGLEVSAGVIGDMLAGRMEIALEQVNWKSKKSGVMGEEGSDSG